MRATDDEGTLRASAFAMVRSTAVASCSRVVRTKSNSRLHRILERRSAEHLSFR